MLTREEEQALEKEKEQNKTTVKTFRLSESTAEAFKEIAATVEGNQNRVFELLIGTYKNEIEKTNLQSPEKLDEFERYLSTIKDLYLLSLKSEEDAKALARQDFANQLESKDNIIYELQIALKAAQEEELKAKDSLIPLNNELDALKKQVLLLEKEIKDKNDKIEASQSQISSIKDELKASQESDAATRRLYEENVANTAKLYAEIDALKKQEGPIKENLSKKVSENKILEAENSRLSKEVDSLTKDIDSLKTTHAAELELVRSQAELKIRNEAYEQVEVIRKELDTIKDKYMAQLESAGKEKEKQTKK